MDNRKKPLVIVRRAGDIGFPYDRFGPGFSAGEMFRLLLKPYGDMILIVLFSTDRRFQTQGSLVLLEDMERKGLFVPRQQAFFFLFNRIGVGDIIVPHAQSRKISLHIDGFESPNILTYSIEHTNEYKSGNSAQ